MSLRSVPGISALVKPGSPKTNGAGELLQPESLKLNCRHALLGSEASASPLRKRQFEFDATKVVRESNVKFQVLPAPERLNASGGPVTPRSVMPWLVAQVILTVPDAGWPTLKM